MDEYSLGDVVLLDCNHIFHYKCLSSQVDSFFKGSSIDFDCCKCKECSSWISIVNPSKEKALSISLTDSDLSRSTASNDSFSDHEQEHDTLSSRKTKSAQKEIQITPMIHIELQKATKIWNKIAEFAINDYLNEEEEEDDFEQEEQDDLIGNYFSGSILAYRSNDNNNN
jgi:hypothetical protein